MYARKLPGQKSNIDVSSMLILKTYTGNAFDFLVPDATDFSDIKVFIT